MSNHIARMLGTKWFDIKVAGLNLLTALENHHVKSTDFLQGIKNIFMLSQDGSSQ